MRTIKYNGIKAQFDERRMILIFEVWGSDDDGDFSAEAEMPARYEVCGSCDGRGTTTRHIECDGGGFTASEWNEMCDGDPDFAEDYFGGKYDRPCPECSGNRVRPVIDLKDDDPAMKPINDQIKSHWEYERECAAERRYGA